MIHLLLVPIDGRSSIYILAPPSPMQVKTFTWPWPRLPTASIIRWGWNAVQEIGLLLAEVRKGV